MGAPAPHTLLGQQFKHPAVLLSWGLLKKQLCKIMDGKVIPKVITGKKITGNYR